MSSSSLDWIITAEELKTCLDQVHLVDVREPEEFEVSFIPGCKLIPLGELHLRAEQELNPNDDLVIYCAHGIRSLHAVAALRHLGFSKTRSLEGGIVAWEELNSL
jgi:adenylyltransferase/sulfurtransferase